MEPFNVIFFGICGTGIDLDYCDVEWFALDMNKDTVIFEAAPSTAFQSLLLTMRATPFLSKGFFPTVVDIMVI